MNVYLSNIQLSSDEDSITIITSRVVSDEELSRVITSPVVSTKDECVKNILGLKLKTYGEAINLATAINRLIVRPTA